MKRILLMACIFIIAVAPFQRVWADDVKAGAVTFKRYCASCHGRTGEGNGPAASSLKRTPADLTILSENNKGGFPKEHVIKTIDGRLMPRAHGDAVMPIWGQWFAVQALADGVLQEDLAGIEDEVNTRLLNLVTYLKTLQK